MSKSEEDEALPLVPQSPAPETMTKEDAEEWAQFYEYITKASKVMGALVQHNHPLIECCDEERNKYVSDHLFKLNHNHEEEYITFPDWATIDSPEELDEDVCILTKHGWTE